MLLCVYFFLLFFLRCFLLCFPSSLRGSHGAHPALGAETIAVDHARETRFRAFDSALFASREMIC